MLYYFGFSFFDMPHYYAFIDIDYYIIDITLWLWLPAYVHQMMSAILPRTRYGYFRCRRCFAADFHATPFSPCRTLPLMPRRYAMLYAPLPCCRAAAYYFAIFRFHY